MKVLTFGDPVGKATSGNWPADDRGDVDDDTPLFGGPGGEIAFVRVLRVDRIGDARVDNERPSRVDVHGLFKVLLVSAP